MTRTVSVELGSDIIYVAGIVNGAAAVWTLVGGSWQAKAERSPDDVYRVELTAIDAAGNISAFSLTLEYGLSGLITDRTRNDVIRGQALAKKGRENMTAAEREEWAAALKGFYNAADMNRVGNAVIFLRAYFAECGYVVDVSPKTDYANDDIPGPQERETYTANIRAIRDKLPVLPGTPPAPGSMEKLTFTAANDIEQILLNVYHALNLLTRCWYQSGETYLNEVY